METSDDGVAIGGAPQAAAPPPEAMHSAPAAPSPSSVGLHVGVEVEASAELPHEVVTTTTLAEKAADQVALTQTQTAMSASIEQSVLNDVAVTTTVTTAPSVENGAAVTTSNAVSEATKANGTAAVEALKESSVPPKPRKMASVGAPRRLRSGSGSGSNSQGTSAVGTVLKRSGRDRTSSGNGLSAVSGGTSGGIVVGTIRRRHRTGGLGRQESNSEDDEGAAAADKKPKRKCIVLRAHVYC